MRARHPGGRANGLRPGYAPQEPTKTHLGLTAETPIPVSRIPRRVGHYLAPLGQQVWLEGEIQDFRWSRAGDLRFSLCGGGVQLECVIWRGQASRLRELTRVGTWAPAAAPRTTVADGDLVAVHGSLSLDRGRVAVRFVGTHIVRSGLATAEVERERVRRALEHDGLLSAARKRRIPKVPRLIALVTSPGSAAEADVLAAAGSRHPGIRIHLVPAMVQGNGAPHSLTEALGRAAAIGDCDVVLLCRGGGSAGELSAFDDEGVARAIARCPMPVVTGIGHETDVTLADLVADVRALTPTAAAVAVVPRREELEAEVNRLREQLRAGVRRRLERERSRLERAGAGVGQAMTFRAERARRVLDQLATELRSALPRRLTVARGRIAAMRTRLHAEMARTLAHRHAHRDVLAAQLAALGPTAILARGYGIARSQCGEVLGSASDFVAGGTFVLTLADGQVVARVLSTSPVLPSEHETTERRPEHVV